MNLVAEAPNGTDPTSFESRWSVYVPDFALYEVGEILQTQWVVCGTVMAEYIAWAAVHLPTPVALTLSFSEERLTSPGDESEQTPLFVKTQGKIGALLNFTDGVARQFGTDPRMRHSVNDTDCAYITDANVVHIFSNATCEYLQISSLIEGVYPDPSSTTGESNYSLLENVTIRVVYLERFVVNFTAHSAGRTNIEVFLTSLD